MANKDILEYNYNASYQSAKKFLAQNNLESAKASFKKAGEFAVQLAEISYGNEREKYINDARSVLDFVKTIEQKIADSAVVKTVVNSAAKNTSPKNGVENAEGANGINYVINGVDVSDFLSKDSNEVVCFDDVKGMEKEKALIEREFFLTEEQRAFNEYLGKKAKTFILLYGVPGTGKTFFAKAISEELKRRLGNDVPFFSIVGSQLSDCKVGATEKNIQAVFEFCKQFEHCVLFIDEFDTIAPDRKQATGDPTAASRVTVLLQMMDGFSSSKGTLVIAATNCPYNLDGAVLSRANTRIEIPLPTYEVIYAVLKGKIGDKLEDDVNLDSLARRLNGYSNRDIKNFIENMKDSLADEFRKNGSNGAGAKGFAQFRFTNAMINKAFQEIVPTTKKGDIERIEKFKNDGE